MPQMSKVELHAAMRRDLRDGTEPQEIVRSYNVSWRMIRMAVESVRPQSRKKRRGIGSRARTVDGYVEGERPWLLPLPPDPFEAGRVFTSRSTVTGGSQSAPTAARCRVGCCCMPTT